MSTIRTVGDEIFEREQALKAKDKQIEALKATLDASVLDNEEYKAIFELQRTRMGEATKLWQEATGKHHILPDLGDLLAWLMQERADALMAVNESERQWHERH